MALHIKKLTDKKDTSSEMYKIVDKFSGDLDCFQINGVPLSSLPFDDYYNYVKTLPYQRDIKGIEFLTRPYHIFASSFPGVDCKKKAILIAAWLKENHYPYRFTAVSSRPDEEIHHVIVEAKINGDWHEIDATYPQNRLGQVFDWTKTEILSGKNSIVTKEPVVVSLYGTCRPEELAYSADEMAGDFQAWAQSAAEPEYMGEPATIIAIVISAVATITAAIIGAVASKKQQERSYKHERKLITEQAKQIERAEQERSEAIAEQQQAAAEANIATMDTLKKLAIPAGIAAALLFL